MELYILVNESGNYGPKAYTDFIHAKQAQKLLTYCDDRPWEIEIVDLPFIGRSVCYITGYHGYNYDFTRGKIYDVTTTSKIYSCSSDAKTDNIWQSAMKRAEKEGPDEVRVSDDRVTCIDHDGYPFVHGDIMEDKFNVSIKRIRVDKSPWSVES